MHDFLIKRGYKRIRIDTKKTEDGIDAGFYKKGNKLIHVDDIIDLFEKFIEENT